LWRHLKVIPSAVNPFDFKFDIIGWMGNAKILIPLVELAKIPSMKSQIKEVLGMEVMSQTTHVVDENEDAPIILQTMN
jgi:hypothetical protein